MASTFESKGRPSRQDALDYHSSGRKGKIEIVPTKPVATSRDLSLAYSPGVAEPCLEIAQDPDLSYKYMIRGNLVAVISNGTAVLGLGDIGAYASKPVMEGKGVLFKKFACAIVFSLRMQTSIGSPSPRMFGVPVRSEQRWPTRFPQYVCGTKPYSVGGWLE